MTHYALYMIWATVLSGPCFMVAVLYRGPQKDPNPENYAYSGLSLFVLAGSLTSRNVHVHLFRSCVLCPVGARGIEPLLRGRPEGPGQTIIAPNPEQRVYV